MAIRKTPKTKYLSRTKARRIRSIAGAQAAVARLARVSPCLISQVVNLKKPVSWRVERAIDKYLEVYDASRRDMFGSIRAAHLSAGSGLQI